MLSVARLLGFLCFLVWFTPAAARDVYILVLGEGSASNCNAHLFMEVRGVYQIGLTGAEKRVRDPFDWADCRGGSIWIPLGRDMIKAKLADKVVFMPVGVEGTKARDWLAGGRAYAKLRSVISTVKARGIDFNYAFWQQGYSDRDSNGRQYFDDLRMIISTISLDIKVDKWIIAQSAGCNGETLGDIEAAQLRLGGNPIVNRFSGPNISELSSAYRSRQLYS